MDSYFRNSSIILKSLPETEQSNFCSQKYENLLILYELLTWSSDLNIYFTLSKWLFKAVKLNENYDP